MNPPESAKKVTRDAFFKIIGPLDVHPTPLGDWPYLSVFKTRDGKVMGWSKLDKHEKFDQYFLL